MASPIVQILAISNVFCRSMFFKNAGDVEHGHCHTYDHGTLISYGRVLVEMLDDDGNTISSKEFTAPSFVFINKFRMHRLTALEDGTVAACIHALRTIDEEIIPEDTLVQQKNFVNNFEDSEFADDHLEFYFKKNHRINLGGLSLTTEDRNKYFAIDSVPE